MRPGVAADQLLQRTSHRLGERHREPQRQRAAEGVAIPGCVLAGGVAHFAAHADLDRPLLGHQDVEPLPCRRPCTSEVAAGVDIDVAGGESGALASQVDLGDRQVAHTPQHVVQLVGRARPTTVGETLQFEFDVGEHVAVEQFTQLLGPQQVAQQVTVERQCGRTAFGQRRITLVHVGRDPVEQQTRRHRARRAGVDVDHPDRACPQLAEHLAQRRHVEHVLQAFARGLEQDREARVLRRDGQQVGRALALLPQRRTAVGSTTRQEQGPPGALTEPGGEHRRLRQRAHDEFVDVFRVDQERVERQFVGRLGQPDHDAVVTPHRLDRDVELIGETSLDRHRPRCVDRCAERAEDADAPVADLVAEPLDDDRPVVRHRAGRLDLFADVLDEVVRRERVEGVVRHQTFDRRRLVEVADLPYERTECPAELQRSPRPVAVPERHLAGLAGRGRDGHPLERDVLDPPRGRAEDERLARARLVDHLLVEFTDPGAVGQEHPEQPAIGDRATRRDRQPLRAVASTEPVVDAIPHEARPQFGELLARIAARQQIEHVVQQFVGDLGEVRAAPHELADLVDRTLLDRGHVGDDLLREHVERIAQEVRRLDQPVDHASGDDRRLEQIAAMLREDRPTRRSPDRVAGPPDALQPPTDRSGRLDLDDEVDRTHVDAEFERRRGHDAAQHAPLQLILDDHPLLPSERTVVRHHEGQVVPLRLRVLRYRTPIPAPRRRGCTVCSS